MRNIKKIFVMDKGFFKDEDDKNPISLEEADLLINGIKLSFEYKPFRYKTQRGPDKDVFGFLIRIETDNEVRMVYSKPLDKVTDVGE